MDLRRIVLTLAVLIAVAAAGSARAQSCQQGGYYGICGPGCSLYYNLIYDPGFDSANCWSFDSGAGQYTSDGPCYWYSDTHGRITGPTNGWKSMYQFTQAFTGGYGFTFSYTVEIDDPNASVEVWVGMHPAQWTLVDTRSGITCDSPSIFLDHPEWEGQPLMVVISGNIPSSGGTIKIDTVQFDQISPGS